jgi:cell division protein ZapA
MQGRHVEVDIFGNRYNIQGDASAEYIRKLARFVDGKMEDVAKTMTSANLVQIAILAAMNIADEYFQLKEIDGTITRDISQKANALISMLEDGIIGDIFPKENFSRELEKETIASSS